MLPRGSSDASLLPYHVDRSELFVMHRLGTSKIFDAARIANAIEFTRFPSTSNSNGPLQEEGLLLRAADLIGQLGDPHYLRKAPALYFEFEEVAMNRQLGCDSPADLVELYPQFYWKTVSTHIQAAIRYLNVTSSGRQWISGEQRTEFVWTSSLNCFAPRQTLAGAGDPLRRFRHACWSKGRRLFGRIVKASPTDRPPNARCSTRMKRL
jgi:hypothetical protein